MTIQTNTLAAHQTLLNTSKRTELSEVVDIDLSRGEDAPTSLSVATSTTTSATVFAGINSSEKDQAAGKNEHLRSFRVGYPALKAKDGETEPKATEKDAAPKTTPLGQLSLFTPSSAVKKETYQRVLRMSPFRSDAGPRIAAIATGLAPKSEVVVFRAADAPKKSDEIGRILLDDGAEAADVDFIALKDEGNKKGTFLLAYCTDYEVFVVKVDPASGKKKKALEPATVYSTPFPDYHAKDKRRTKFRALRFLTPNKILLCSNTPDRSGASLKILSLVSHSSLGLITLEKRLHKTLKIALGMDISALSASQTGEQQFVIAVAGSDQSIELLTIEQGPAPNYNMSNFKLYTILREVHPYSLTKIAFSTFIPPTLPLASDSSILPQSLKLASVSMGNTAVVHTLPLSPTPTTGPNARSPRYILYGSKGTGKSETLLSITSAILVVGLVAFLLQAFVELRGGSPEHLGVKQWLSPSLQEKLAKPYLFAEQAEHVLVEGKDAMKNAADKVSDSLPDTNPVSVSIEDTTQAIRDILTSRHSLLSSSSSSSSAQSDSDSEKAQQEGPSTALILHDPTSNSLSLTPHTDAETVASVHKKWEDLAEHEKKLWRRRLADAGHWALDEAETVLKGMFFGEIGGVVGGIVREL